MHILVVGGTGFIGQHLAGKLCAQGHKVTIPTRAYGRARDLLVYPTATVLQADVHDEAVIDRLMARQQAVINLVGILHSRPGKPYGPDFERAHVQLPRKLAQAACRHGVARLLHVSALGADPAAPSMYLRSKADGEAAIRAAYQAAAGAGEAPGTYTLFRPSVVFGPQDNFLNLFARLARWFPVLPVGGADARMQPVHVDDVARAILNALTLPSAAGATYELAGPDVLTLRELVALAARASGRPRPVLGLPDGLARLQALFFECLPGQPLMTRDNLDSLKADNVASRGIASELGVVPTPVAAAVGYLRR
ncbi:complex I NDUFA9 subunit family protein [Orrella sp. JC864]|uniref:complex I NDUFA9 subunit family protein n=1 Tax=Orrella sp. JC864 TaxID=3120298 RepID=UPI0030086C98